MNPASAIPPPPTHYTSLSPPHTVLSPKSDDDGPSGSAVAWGYIVFDYLVKQVRVPLLSHPWCSDSIVAPPMEAL